MIARYWRIIGVCAAETLEFIVCFVMACYSLATETNRDGAVLTGLITDP